MLFLRSNLQASSKYVEVISTFFQLSFLKMVWFLWFYRASSLWFWWVTWCLSLWTVFMFLNRKVVYFWPMFHLIVIYHYNRNHFSILFCIFFFHTCDFSKWKTWQCCQFFVIYFLYHQIWIFISSFVPLMGRDFLVLSPFISRFFAGNISFALLYVTVFFFSILVTKSQYLHTLVLLVSGCWCFQSSAF